VLGYKSSYFYTRGTITVCVSRSLFVLRLL
jgi:hypothetical protein